jgi:hypothetical protein
VPPSATALLELPPPHATTDDESGADRRVGNTGRVPQAVRRSAVREIHSVVRGATPTHAHLRSRIAFVIVVTLLLDAVASLVILLFERDARGTGITNLGDAVFWTSTQLLTVSSQLPNPISAPARVLDVFLQAYAISVVAVLAGSFGAFFHRRGIERDPLHPPSGAGRAPAES